MKPIKALLILGVIVAAVAAAFVYLPKPEDAPIDATVDQGAPADAAAPAGKGGKKAEDAPRLEEKYGVTGPGVPGL